MLSQLVNSICNSNEAVTEDEFITKPPYKDGIIDHGHGVTQEFENGNEYWYKDGLLHRDNDLPAVVGEDGYLVWCQHGRIHRDGDKPAVVMADGMRQWCQHGKLHRDGGKPAIIRPNGAVERWVNGRPDASS